MMDNKCNKTPNKYLDHVYCQPGGENKNYMRSNNNNASGSNMSGAADILALLRENKQLKSMLILHLDLIQEQSDQLLAKDKQISSLQEELQTVRAKNAQFDLQIQELQRQVQRHIKRSAVGELALSPPPLAKIQCKKDGSANSPTNIIGECNGKLISKIILQRVNLPDGTIVDTHSPNSTTTISDTASEETATNQQHEELEEEEDIEELTTEESNDGAHSSARTTSTTALPSGAKPRPPLGSVATALTTTSTPTAALPTVKVCVTPPTPSRGKQMPLMLWHAPNIHSEEDSGSCDDSTADIEQHQTHDASSASCQTKQPETPETPRSKARKTLSQQAQASRQRQSQSQDQQQQQRAHKHKRRCAYITTQQMYATREWEDEDEAVCDYEFSQAEAEALHAEAPMLEIPKWTEHELTPSYCIEGTEDLSDELFQKRHAKLEIDERRRKKWDVQQIREQRRVEKLKRRHCKNEVQSAEQMLKSFYPQPDNLQSICFVNELPVQAFGEIIPKLNTNGEFILPWLQTENNSTTNVTTTATASTISTITTTSATATTTPTTSSMMFASSAVEIMANSTASSTSAQAQMQKSSFVFLKKRKRQQSSSAVGIGGSGGSTVRQRTSVASKAAQQTGVIAVVSTATSLPVTTATVNETIITPEETVTPGEEQK